MKAFKFTLSVVASWWIILRNSYSLAYRAESIGLDWWNLTSSQMDPTVSVFASVTFSVGAVITLMLSILLTVLLYYILNKSRTGTLIFMVIILFLVGVFARWYGGGCHFGCELWGHPWHEYSLPEPLPPIPGQ